MAAATAAVLPVAATTPNLAAWRVLPGADFADAYRVTVTGLQADAPALVGAIHQLPQPGWMRALMRLRNWLVGPFGLRTAQSVREFPVVHSAPDEVHLGFDDRHLDFRIILNVAAAGQRQQDVTLTTVVRTHNLWGRTYLRLIMPFHVAICRHLLGRLAAEIARNAA